ncbi:cyclic nucleotide-binding protein [Nitzschia inconspicua]|uniref:Cyclic nucleotide-binding protein n=1 Tax=Nitzschia inconspicua TaxID=303405 RepID=A0A9K3KLH2_9STRA|nr:cyclic nucleotide-binding protein [Nitzschia inconspicua]
MASPNPRSSMPETSNLSKSPNHYYHHHHNPHMRSNSITSSGGGGRDRLRRGSVQLMHDINVQQFPYPHGESSLPNSPIPTASPLSLLSTLLSGNTEQQQQPLPSSKNDTEDAVDATTTTFTTTTTTTTSVPGYDTHDPSTADVAFSHTTDGTVLEANSVSKRRVARELLNMSEMRHTRSIVDPRWNVDRIGDFDYGSDTDDDDDNNNNNNSNTEDNGGIFERWLFNNEINDQDVPHNEEQQKLLQDVDDNNDYDEYCDDKDHGIYGAISDPPGVPKLDHSVSYDRRSFSLRQEVGLSGVDSGHGGGAVSVPSSARPSIKTSVSTKRRSEVGGWISSVVQQVSAVAVVALLNMMMAIPFGASYFPIGWKADDVITMDAGSAGTHGDTGDDVNGKFPLPGKQALGLRMFLFATMVAQLVFAFKSKFHNAVGLQMVENVPFLHALANTVIARQGYGADALSTLFFLFGLSSVIVGMVFYLLGRLQLGKIVYFFPNHVLVGCIGGIGVFIVFTSMEVTTNTTFSLNMDGIMNLIDNFQLLWIVLVFDATLRMLTWITEDKDGRPRYQLLSPIFYIMITPIFYLGLLVAGISVEEARDRGYFFPATDNGGSSGDNASFFDPHLWDIFHVIDVRSISWMAVLESTGTMIALAAFSLIHVPINIPAFAISTDVETDMNAELIAHGYSNALSGVFGGLQNYMTYSNSVLYAKTGGKGLISSLVIVVFTAGLFVVGPSMCDFLPRCLAGTLLLHIGIDLVLEGVYDSIGQYDYLEYAGIWLITIVMTVWGMTAALIAGIVSALSTYAVQSINYHNPIRQILSASSLRSSAWTRCAGARAILENEKTGRARILIFQLNGHLFFGNVAQLTDTIKDVLREKSHEGDLPIVVILDFTLVVGMDSSAAHAITKLKKIIHRLFHVEISIFVTGSDRGGFPCEYALSEALAGERNNHPNDEKNDTILSVEGDNAPCEPPTKGYELASKILNTQLDGRVCESLDEALRFAEDILIARKNPQFLASSSSSLLDDGGIGSTINLTVDEERFRAKKYLKDLLEYPDDTSQASSTFLTRSIDMLVSMMTREEYKQDNILWEQGADSTSLKIIVSGELLSIIDETGASEVVVRGNVVGELGLVQPGMKRLTTLICTSPKAILYSLDRDDWTRLKRNHPQVASLIDGLVIRYLAHRVQHVSNRYFHTTLPV